MNYMSIIDNIEWRISEMPVDYLFAVQEMENRVAQINNGDALELIWLLEHPSIYTAGSSARYEDLLEPDRFPVHHTGRGGQFTYHGPGQLVCYPIIDLHDYKMSISWYMRMLENVVIDCLQSYGIESGRKEGLTGVWVGDDKICAMGVRLARWVTMHGFAFNLNPDMTYFDGMIPCGIFEYGVTSLQELDIHFSSIDIQTKIMNLFNNYLSKNTNEV